MKRLIIFLVLSIITMIPFNSIASSKINLSIDGNQVNFSESLPYVDESNRTQIPMRTAAESFGAEISWNNDTKTAIVKYMGTTVELPIGCNYMIINGNKSSMDTVATIKDGRTYLPIRPVFEALGAKVSWDDGTKTIIVDKAGITNKFETEMKESNIISYEEFRDMFKYDGTLLDNSDAVWISADYNGKLSESSFAELWRSIPDKYKEYYMKKIAIEKQEKNSKYSAFIVFNYDRTGVFVKYSLGNSNCNINGNASANPENPFDKEKINSVN